MNNAKRTTIAYVDPQAGPTLMTGVSPGRWIQNRGAKMQPCDGLCKEHFPKGAWYFNQPNIGALCERCARLMLDQIRAAPLR